MSSRILLNLLNKLGKRDKMRSLTGILQIKKIDETRAQREHSGSVVECLTQDQGVGCSSLTGVAVLCP